MITHNVDCCSGNRKGWKPTGDDKHPPHNLLLTYMGMCFIWVGWYGFNGGSADTADPGGAWAILATQIATAVATLSWMATEMLFEDKPSVLGS